MMVADGYSRCKLYSDARCDAVRLVQQYLTLPSNQNQIAFMYSSTFSHDRNI
jgi:hypothetical protein